MGKGSSASLSRHRSLKLGQCSLGMVTRAIFHNGRPRITVWIVNRVVHQLVRTICRISSPWRSAGEGRVGLGNSDIDRTFAAIKGVEGKRLMYRQPH
jgi:hypothetical protein